MQWLDSISYDNDVVEIAKTSNQVLAGNWKYGSPIACLDRGDLSGELMGQRGLPGWITGTAEKILETLNTIETVQAYGDVQVTIRRKLPIVQIYH